jgi:hypothetical protein
MKPVGCLPLAQIAEWKPVRNVSVYSTDRHNPSASTKLATFLSKPFKQSRSSIYSSEDEGWYQMCNTRSHEST